jgi:uncharacterized protein (DUF1800 family)
LSLLDATIALNRFGLGARPGEIKTVAGDPRGWLIAQLTQHSTLPAPLAALPSTKDDTYAFILWLESLGLAGDAIHPAELSREGKPPQPVGGPGAMDTMSGASLSVEQSYRNTFLPRYETALEARFMVATTTDQPFFERLTHFWGNHFTVSASKPESIATVASFDRDVARKHATGKFADILIASCTHPAMLVYLDNVFSVGPDSFIAQHPDVLPPTLRSRMKGINENLAREVLELHTLGVRSGYTQADVTSFAKVLTGWLILRPGRSEAGQGETGLFHFQPYAHEPGEQVILGQRYDQEGLDQGMAALDDLAHHPATARHIAFKIARHFVADDPPPPVVERLAKTYRDTDGDVKSIMIALINSAEAWRPGGVKLKPPEDYIISAVRALGGPSMGGEQLLSLFDRMGQKPYFASGPDGWADVEANWIGPDPIWKRIEWAAAVSRSMATAGVDPAGVAVAALGTGVSADTLRAIRLAESPAQGLAIFLASAEFQRR